MAEKREKETEKAVTRQDLRMMLRILLKGVVTSIGDVIEMLSKKL